MMHLLSVLQNKTVKNAGYLIIGKIVQMIFGVIVGVLTARYLGPANYGLLNYAGAYTSFFTVFCTLGINSVLVKELVDHPDCEGVVIGTSLCLRCISSFMSTVAIIIISSVVDSGEKGTILIVALSCVGMFFHVFEVFNYWFQRKLESRIITRATLIAYLISSAYKVYLLATGKSVVYFAMVSSVDYLCLGLILSYEYKRNHGQRLEFSWAYGKQLLKRSGHFILPGLMVSIYGYTDKFMLKQMISESEIGYYATAASLCGMWCFVLTAVIDSIYPTIMEAAKMKNENEFKKRNIQLYAIVFYMSVAVSLVLTVLAKPIIYILYGEQFLPTVKSLRIVTWYIAFSYLGVARNAWIVAKNRQKCLLPIYMISAATNIILNYMLIPLFGAPGAAFASLITQVTTILVVPLFIREIKENSVLMLDAIRLKFY